MQKEVNKQSSVFRNLKARHLIHSKKSRRKWDLIAITVVFTAKWFGFSIYGSWTPRKFQPSWKTSIQKIRPFLRRSTKSSCVQSVIAMETFHYSSLITTSEKYQSMIGWSRARRKKRRRVRRKRKRESRSTSRGKRIWVKSTKKRKSKVMRCSKMLASGKKIWLKEKKTKTKTNKMKTTKTKSKNHQIMVVQKNNVSNWLPTWTAWGTRRNKNKKRNQVERVEMDKLRRKQTSTKWFNKL